MAEREVSVTISADIRRFSSEMARAATSADKLADSGRKVGTQLDQTSVKSDKLGTSLSRTTKQTTGLGDGLTKSQSKLAAFDKTLARIDRRADDIGRVSNAFLGIGTAAVVGVGLAVKAYADFDSAISAVAATGDDARKNLDALRAAALQAGADTAFSATEAAAGVENLIKAGVSAQDVLGGGLKGALDLAAAGSLDVATAAEIAATAMTQFGLNGSDVPHIADLLAAAAGKAQGEVSDMAQALAQSGLVADQFGLSIEETTGTLAAFASAGLLGSDAGTAFKTMLTQLANPSKESAALMRDLGITAYDAQGQFVGITNLAGQLEDNLKNLAPAQRDQALAQIFGNDALRAANVLMTQGEGGIKKWIEAVNDSGYAADTARTKLDNLKGDLEALKGALETALIGAGEGVDAPLRQLVQGLTEIINAWNDLDSETKQAVVSIVATVGGVLLAVWVLGKLTVAGAEVLTAFRNLSGAAGSVATAMPRASGAIAKAGRVSLGAAAGITALVLAIKLAGDQLYNGPIVRGTEQVEAALLKLQKTGDSTDLDRMFQVDPDGFFNKSGQIIDGVDDLGSALDRFANKDWQESINDFGSELFAFTGLPNAWVDLKNQIGEIDRAFASLAESGSYDRAAEQFTKVAAEGKLSVDQLIEAFPEYKRALQEQANQLEVTNLSNEDYVRWMKGEIPAAVTQAQTAQEANTGAIEKATEFQEKHNREVEDAARIYSDAELAMLDAKGTSAALQVSQEQLKTAQADLNTELEKTIDNFSILNEEALNADRANISYEESLAELRDTTKDAAKEGDKHARSLNAETESGRKNRGAVLDAISALNDKTTATFEDEVATKGLKTATDNASKSLQQGKEDIREAGRAAGLSEDEIDDMIDEMVKTPKELKTDVNTPGIKDAEKRIKDLERQIKALEGRVLEITTDFSVKGTTLDFKTGKAVKVGSKVLSGDWHTGGYTGDGGKFEEAGTVHKGEVVFEQEAVAAAGGPDRLDRFRRDLRSGSAGLYGYAYGGIVGRRPTMLSGRPSALTSRPRGLGGRPTEEEEIEVHGAITGSTPKINNLLDYYAREITTRGTALADEIGKQFAKTAEDALSSGAGGDFTKIDVNNPRGLTTYRGGRFTNLFAKNLQRAEQIAGQTIRVFQGGWRPATSYSGTSHAGDAIDLQVSSALIKALRSVGIPAWDRTGKGNWVAHTHAIPLPGAGYPGGSAVWQGQDYLRGGDGLANGGPIWGPGGPTDDRIPIWASNGEFMIREKAAKILGYDTLAKLNALGGAGVMTRTMDGYANGGPVAPSAFGYSRSFDVSVIVKLIRAIEQPIKDLSKLTKEIATVRKESTKEAAETRRLREVLRDTKPNSKERERAQDRYDAQAERSRAATDRLKEAQQELAQAQQEVANTARQVSDEFRSAYDKEATDVRQWLDLMKTGTKDIGSFLKQIQTLRNRGLSETLIQQVLGMGATSGGVLASQIIAGGKPLIGELNKVSQCLQDVSDRLGYLGATGQGRYAAGGPVTGSGTGISDSVPILASAGEWVVPAAAVPKNRAFLESITYNRPLINRSYTRGYRYGGEVRAAPMIDTEALHQAMSGMTVQVQNPWTGAYHESRMRVVAEGVQRELVDSFGRSR